MLNQMYHWFIQDRLNEGEIASQFNGMVMIKKAEFTQQRLLFISGALRQLPGKARRTSASCHFFARVVWLP